MHLPHMATQRERRSRLRHPYRVVLLVHAHTFAYPLVPEHPRSPLHHGPVLSCCVKRVQLGYVHEG